MAAGTTLKMTFACASGNEKTISLRRASSQATSTNIKALMNSIIANGDLIWTDAPTSLRSAVLQTVSETAIDLS